MIYNIDFLAKLPPKSVRQRMLSTLSACKSMKGAVAYWTIGTDFFQNKLSKALALPDSFISVDLKRPTNIDRLTTFVKKKSNIFLHHYILDTTINGETKDNLLHEKVLLFEFENNAEIWVGSHNMTIRALSGINKEAALIIKLSKDDRLFEEVKAHLEAIRNICIPFNLKHIEYYKWLQGIFDNPVTILKMFTSDLNSLKTANATIQLLGLDNFGYGAIKTVSKHVYLEIENGSELTHFLAEVLLVGNIDPLNPASYEIDFQPMMYAFIRKNIIPIIISKYNYNIHSNRIKRFKYLVNIRIIEEIPSLSYIKLPKNLWEYENIEFENYNNDDDSPRLFKSPEYIRVKKAAVAKITNQVVSFMEKPKTIINPGSIQKLLNHYDEIISNDSTEDTLKLSNPVPDEFKKKNNEIIFKALISKSK